MEKTLDIRVTLRVLLMVGTCARRVQDRTADSGGLTVDFRPDGLVPPMHRTAHVSTIRNGGHALLPNYIAPGAGHFARVGPRMQVDDDDDEMRKRLEQAWQESGTTRWLGQAPGKKEDLLPLDKGGDDQPIASGGESDDEVVARAMGAPKEQTGSAEGGFRFAAPKEDYKIGWGLFDGPSNQEKPTETVVPLEEVVGTGRLVDNEWTGTLEPLVLRAMYDAFDNYQPAEVEGLLAGLRRRALDQDSDALRSLQKLAALSQQMERLEKAAARGAPEWKVADEVRTLRSQIRMWGKDGENIQKGSWQDWLPPSVRSNIAMWGKDGEK